MSHLLEAAEAGGRRRRRFPLSVNAVHNKCTQRASTDPRFPCALLCALSPCQAVWIIGWVDTDRKIPRLAAYIHPLLVPLCPAR